MNGGPIALKLLTLTHHRALSDNLCCKPISSELRVKDAKRFLKERRP